MDWCSDNNLVLNFKKTKELLTDFRKKYRDPTPLYSNGDRVERVTSSFSHTFLKISHG